MSSVFSLYYYEWLLFLLPSPDYSKGFGGKYGVDKEKVDKSAVGFEYQGKIEKHESQKGFYFILLHEIVWPSLNLKL